MAYNETNNGLDLNFETDPEERKRRLAMMASLATGVPVGDVATQAVDNRLGDLTKRYEEASKFFGAPAQEANPADTEVETKTVKTYGDGSQEHITKTQVPAPVAPEQVQQEQAQAVAQPQPVQQQAPVAQVQQPVAPQQQEVQQPPQQVAQPVAPEQVQLPQPGPATQVAGPAQLQPNAQLSAGAAQQIAQTAGQQAQPQVAAPAQDDLHRQAIEAVRNIEDPQQRTAGYAALLSNPNVSSGTKAMAQRFIAEDYQKQKAQRDAEQKIAEATPNDLARYMQTKSTEGSYLKAILFQRLGLTELAKEEQQKLGAGTKTASAVDSTTGQRYTVETNANGEVIRAFNSQGNKASQEELARLSAATLPTKAHLLPAVHGSPVVNSAGEMGTLMMDPQTQSTYVLVGNQKRPTTGWTTMAQNVNNVYNASQAGALGKGAGEGFTPQPMRPLPGSAQPAAATVIPGTPEETRKALDRAQADVAGTDREIARLSSLPNTDPTKQQRIGIIQQEKVAAQQRVQQLSGAVQGLPAGAGTQSVPGGGIAQQKANLAVQEAQQKEGIQVAGARSQAFNKILDEEVRPQAQQGDTIVNTRKQQFAIFDRPGVDAAKIFGIANGAGQAPGDQRWTMLRDIVYGKVAGTEDQIRERAAALGLNREEQSALAEYNIANAKINAATLKQTAGAGSVSDAEQRANREMNVDPTKIPGLGAYNAMAQSQFSGDMARYKADWASTHPATNALQLDKAWRKESQTLTEMYANIAKERAKYITENGATTASVKEGYKRYPIPEYDPQTETWKKTKPLAQIFGR